jgi:hypothetical protein
MNEPQNKRLTVLLVVLILVLTGSAGFYVYLQQKQIIEIEVQLNESQAQTVEIQAQLNEAKAQIVTLQNRINEMECKGNWKDGVCTKATLSITSPMPGDSVCMNETGVKIAWLGPDDLKSVDITFPVQGTYFPVVKEFVTKYPNQPMKNEYTWNLADFIAKNKKREFDSWYTPIVPNNNYKVMINGTTPSGEYLVATSDYFSLIDCK